MSTDEQPDKFEELFDEMKCENPDCHEEHGEFFLHSRCHPQAPLTVALEQGHRVMRIRCAACDALVLAIVP